MDPDNSITYHRRNVVTCFAGGQLAGYIILGLNYRVRPGPRGSFIVEPIPIITIEGKKIKLCGKFNPTISGINLMLGRSNQPLKENIECDENKKAVDPKE